MGVSDPSRRWLRQCARAAFRFRGVAPLAAALALLAQGVLSPARATMSPPHDRASVLHATLSAPPAAGGAVLGSAFAIGAGVFVTNAHVVARLAPGAVVTLSVGAAPRRTARARLLAVSARMDLAVLQAPEGFLPAVSWRPAAAPAASRISAAGVRVTAEAPQGRVVSAHGHVAGAAVVSARFGEGVVAVMPGVGPGFSGGPAVDEAGRLVGMVTAVRLGGATAPAGSAFAPITVSARSGPAEAFIIAADALRAEALRLLATVGR